MRLILLGPPGAGKGTLADSLKKSLNLVHFSTGDLLREEIRKKTPLGIEAKICIDKGNLVPDSVATRLIENKLLNIGSDNSGFMLDGFPRTVKQAEDLDEFLKKINKPINYAVYLESTLPMIIFRLSGRRVCRNCGKVFHIRNHPFNKNDKCCENPDIYQREDDTEETILKRMEVYKESTQPLIDYYRGKKILAELNSELDTPILEDHLIKLFHENGQID